jgi:ATP-dependent helicase/DNAse subunit B
MYNEDFDLKKEYDNYLLKRNLSNKEKFFVNKLYSNLEEVIKTIKYQESLSLFNNTLTEQKVFIDKSNKIKVNFMGFIDKIKYKKEDDIVLCAIIDYKTGSVETTLDNINDGLHLQLPVYIYLTKKLFNNEVKITGFYLQKIINNAKVDVDNVEEDIKSRLKLEGYTLSDENIIEEFDSSYENSQVIKSMCKTKNGFARYSKLISEEEIDKIIKIVEDKINEVIKGIENTDFKINPKRIDNSLVGCNYCKYHELCYKKEENIVNLDKVTIDKILERKELENAELD